MCVKNNYGNAFPRDLGLACFLSGLQWPTHSIQAEGSTEKLSLLRPLEVWNALPDFLLLLRSGPENGKAGQGPQRMCRAGAKRPSCRGETVAMTGWGLGF